MIKYQTKSVSSISGVFQSVNNNLTTNLHSIEYFASRKLIQHYKSLKASLL